MKLREEFGIGDEMQPLNIGARIISILILSSAVAFGQLQSGATPTQAPQAVAILAQSLNAVGGASAIAVIQDFTETGNVTFNWGAPVQGAVTVKGMGFHEFRVDATLADGVHSWIVNSNASYQINPDGSIIPLPSQNLVKPASFTLPILRVLMATQDTSTNISYGGLVTHDGQQLHDVQVEKIFSQSVDPTGALSTITKADIYIDPNTLLIQSISDTAYRRDGGPGGFAHEVQFANYQVIGGVLVPFSVTEFIANQQTQTIQLTHVTFNTGLTDSNFN
jgi:outer membrane lipoprotein-sorting protein